MTNVRAPAEDEILVCTICKATFKSPQILEDHLHRSHKPPGLQQDKNIEKSSGVDDIQAINTNHASDSQL